MPVSLLVLVSVVAAALASMAVFAGLGARRDADVERKRSQFVLGFGDFAVHWFVWAIGPAERLALRLGLGPDAFNFAGLAFGLCSGGLIAAGRVELGGWAIALGGVADILDGRIARARGLDSRYGMFIDSALDRFVEVFALLGFAFYLRGFPAGSTLAAAALAGSLLVSYTRARGESVGVLCKEGLMQRGERLVLTCLAALTDPHVCARLGWRPGTVILWTLGAIAAGTFWTAVHRTVWISLRLRGR